jgi:hypothetical protein
MKIIINLNLKYYFKLNTYILKTFIKLSSNFNNISTLNKN